MKIRNLSSTAFEDVIACFLTSFEGYFVQLPNDFEYWRGRFVTARVNWELSFGMFDGEKLVGYIINGIDNHQDKLTAYNTGTGVLPEYRGQAIIDRLYEFAVPVLKDHGIEKCLLEVICENERALKVYKRIGFSITRHLRTFSGTLPRIPSEENLQKCHFSQVLNSGIFNAEHYSWDNTAEAVLLMGENVQTWCLGEENSPEAYLVIDPSGSILQLESKKGEYDRLLTAANLFTKDVKLKNVDGERKNLLHTLEKWHFSNPVNQFEMEMSL